MSKEHYDLETLALAHITKSTKSIDLFLERKITAEHFTYVSDGEAVSYTQGLFNMIVKYYEQSGGSLFTSYILDQKLKNKKVKESSKAKLLTLWEDIENTDVDDNNLYEVLQQLKNRRCNALLSEMLTDSYNSIASQDIKTTLSVIQDNVDKIQDELSEFGADRHAFDVTQSGDFFKDEYEKRIKHPELFKGIDCGVSNIDSKTFGWLPGQIIVFLAPSSGGKSVMLLNSAMHANKNCNKKVLYMSFEMNSWLCLLRHISLSFEIPYSQLKDNNLSPDELRAIVDGLNNSKDGAYFEYDVNMEDPTPEYIDSRIRELIATKGKPDLLVVDYIGNMTVRNAVNGSKDWENQSKAITELFKMAKRYNIPIITAQQINRETIRDSRKSKEANKFMSYDQAAASGGQNLMHLCTYAIAMEPNREKGYCVFHPVKMRDAWFNPFPVRMNPEYNKVEEMSLEEQQTVMGLHAASNGVVTSTDKVASGGKTPMNTKRDEESPELIYDIPTSDDEEEINLADWVLQ